PQEPDDAAPERIVRVALPIPLDQLFDYRLASGHRDAPTGTRVRVHFAGQLLIGLVVPNDLMGLEAESQTGDSSRRLSLIDAVVDEEPVVSESMLRMLAAEAKVLFAPIGVAVAHALPPGSTPRMARPYALTPRAERILAHGVSTSAALTRAAGALLGQLGRKPMTLASLSRSLAKASNKLSGMTPKTIERLIHDLVKDGLIERRFEARAPTARIPTDRIVRMAPAVDLENVLQTTLLRAQKQAALLRQIAESPDGIATRTLGGVGTNTTSLLRELARRELVVFEERPRLFATETILDGGHEVTLTADQASSLRPICDAIEHQKPARFLLHGVTGSGKTEVYLRAIAQTLAINRQALLLVPEITLTHQIIARVRARFGDEVAVLHSGLRPGERLAQWERLRTGQTAIAVGARSALFAPLDALGLIVIDEEHDGAYKNDEGFRYHARELAQRLARATHCPLILGSATPSLETRHQADCGEIERLSLPRRVAGRPLPAVEIIDLAKEKAKQSRGRKLILSKPLRLAIKETLEKGGQTILFLNRRGFSTRIFCFQCGHAERCDDCDVALVFHAADHHLRCHYCDHTRSVPESCSGCGDPETALLGVGTERLEEEVRSLFPNARTMRLDRDVAARRGHTEDVLRALKDRQVDIVIGTQMVAKGHDFPGVQLVGVVAADIGLHLPDFRAAERTFQLLTQVAGRAGRADRPGRVIVQTFVPDHYALAPVGSHDYESFYTEEISHRKALGYPPFASLMRTVVQAEDEAVAKAAAEKLAEAARAEIPENGGVEILGPAPAPLAKLRGRYRFMLLAKGRDEALLRKVALAQLSISKQFPRSVQMGLDARPVNML
ncbi:MAG: primosomal protein N', partial [Myxococcota bacterium]